MTAMEVTITCSECGSAISVYPSKQAKVAKCGVCSHEEGVNFDANHEKGLLKDCPVCERKDFYSQKDFNRKLGVLFFIIAAILSIWTYGLSLVALWLVDFFLFRKIGNIAVCYKCGTIFRKIENMNEIPPYDHEMNDRIVYSDQNFHGKSLDH